MQFFWYEIFFIQVHFIQISILIDLCIIFKVQVKLDSVRKIIILGNSYNTLYDLETCIHKINHCCETVIFIDTYAFNAARQEFYIKLDMGYSEVMVNFGF